MDDQLFDLIAQWEDLRKDGRSVALEELCSACPARIEDLRAQIRVIQAMELILELPNPDGATLPFDEPASAARPAPTGFAREIEGYEILDILDEGGMGIVYKARQKGLERLVALKTISGPRIG